MFRIAFPALAQTCLLSSVPKYPAGGPGGAKPPARNASQKAQRQP